SVGNALGGVPTICPTLVTPPRSFSTAYSGRQLGKQTVAIATLVPVNQHRGRSPRCRFATLISHRGSTQHNFQSVATPLGQNRSTFQLGHERPADCNRTLTHTHAATRNCSMFGLRKQKGSRKRPLQDQRPSRRWGIELLEPRHMASASRFHPTHFAVP